MAFEAQISVSHTFFDEEATKSADDLTRLPIDILEQYCLSESRRFQRTGQSATEYGFELCRRALMLQSEIAWAALMRVYGQLVAHWVRNHPSFTSSSEEETYFVNRAFERLWRNVACKPRKFEKFDSLEAILRFVKLCVHSAVMDDGPNRVPVAEVPIEKVETLLIGQPNIQLNTHNEFWQMVQRYLNNEAERIAIAGYFLYDMKNREVVQQYPDLFQNTKQLSNLRLTVLRRLSRVPAFESKLRGIIDQPQGFVQQLVC